MKEPEPQVTSVKAEVTPEALNAAGQSCLALATAITGLVQKELLDEAKELSYQLSLTSRSLRWLIRENRQYNSGSINTKDIQVDTESPVCLYMRGFLRNGERKAVDVIGSALENGYTKSEVFKAKEFLRLQVKQKRNNKWWSLPEKESDKFNNGSKLCTPDP